MARVDFDHPASLTTYDPAIDPIAQIPQCISTYPTVLHFVTEMCTHVLISVTKWFIVGDESGALRNLWDWSLGFHISNTQPLQTKNACLCVYFIVVQNMTNIVPQLTSFIFNNEAT